MKNTLQKCYKKLNYITKIFQKYFKNISNCIDNFAKM